MSFSNYIKIRGARVRNLKNVDLDIPLGKIVGIAGVSGSGKTTLVLESLVPAPTALTSGGAMPPHVRSLVAEGIERVKLIDSTPIGLNVRSTVASCSGMHNELRRIFARTPDAKRPGFKAGDFSYNTGRLRRPVCDGTGSVSLDVQFLPDVDIPCPECRSSRYSAAAHEIKYVNERGEHFSLPELAAADVDTASSLCADMKTVSAKLGLLRELGLGYLTLGEEGGRIAACGTPAEIKNNPNSITGRYI